MSMLLFISAALAAGPTVSGSWQKGAALLTVQPPAGEHLNEEGPLSGWVAVDGQRLELSGSGALLAVGLAVAAPKGSEITGTLSVPLCEDEGGACRLASVSFQGTPARKAVLFAEVAPPAPPQPAPHAESVEAAFAEAEATGRMVLLDFGAVWCPPCNLLSAELLEDPADAEALSGFVVVAVDVDDHSSWSVKDRYDVGGYPTLVIARPDGAEVDRMVGYPGEEKTLGWLASAPGGVALADLPEPEARPDAADIARRLAEAGDDEAAAAWLAVATDTDTVAFRRARLAISPDIEDVRWLMGQGVSIEEWIWPAMGMTEADPTLTGELLVGIRRALPSASPLLAADLLYAAANLSPPEAAPTFYAAGAAALIAGLTGDLALDRGHTTFLATLHERAGDVDAGLAVLTEAAAAYPDEFTFHYAAAGLLLRAERLDDALESVGLAVEHGYGDNRLRAVKRKADILAAQGLTDEAVGFIDAALAAVEAPDAALNVRTPRYLSALQTLREELTAEE